MPESPRPLTALGEAPVARLIAAEPESWPSMYEAQVRSARVESVLLRLADDQHHG
jgi:hypothetical protein